MLRFVCFAGLFIAAQAALGDVGSARTSVYYLEAAKSRATTVAQPPSEHRELARHSVWHNRFHSTGYWPGFYYFSAPIVTWNFSYSPLIWNPVVFPVYPTVWYRTFYCGCYRPVIHFGRCWRW